MSYPSHITNIYELLDQDGEAPSTVRAVAPAKNTTPAKSAPAKGSSSAPAKSTQQSSAPRDNQRRGDRQQGERQQGERQGEGRGGFRQDNRAPRQQRGEGGFNAPREGGFNAPREGGFNAPRNGGNEGDSDRQPVEFARRDRPYEGEGSRESRGDSRRRGAPAGGFVGNKRFNDRKSGSGSRGRPGEEKRQGRGRGNWGVNDGSDVVVDEDGEVKEGVPAEGAETSVTTDKVEEPHVETEEEKAKREDREKDAKMMTLDDYKKQQEAKRQASSLTKGLEVRKANEGVDPNQAKKWSSLQQIKRDEEEVKPTSAASTEEKKKEEKKGGKNVVRLDEIFQVKETPRPRYEDSDDRRGGRGGGRGGRGGRGGSRGSSQRTERTTRTGGSGADVADFSDPNSFPTLQ